MTVHYRQYATYTVGCGLVDVGALSTFYVVCPFFNKSFVEITTITCKECLASQLYQNDLILFEIGCDGNFEKFKDEVKKK